MEIKKDFEDSYFVKRDKELLIQMKKREIHNREIAALENATQIADRAFLEKLFSLGVTSKKIKAFELFPLIQVAWSDGEIDNKEKQRIMKVVVGDGVEIDSPAFIQLQQWLTEEPSVELRNLWRRFIALKRDKMNDKQVYSYNQKILEGIVDVAKSSGGILGFWSKISGNEQEVIDSIRLDIEQ